MTEDEERHADEVNIAFQMGAEWERKQSKVRIEKLEAELHRCFHRIEGLQVALRGLIEANGNGWHPMKINGAEWFTARKALEGKDG